MYPPHPTTVQPPYHTSYHILHQSVHPSYPILPQPFSSYTGLFNPLTLAYTILPYRTLQYILLQPHPILLYNFFILSYPIIHPSLAYTGRCNHPALVYTIILHTIQPYCTPSDTGLFIHPTLSYLILPTNCVVLRLQVRVTANAKC